MKNNVFDILTLCSIILFYVLHRSSLYLWAKGEVYADYIKLASYIFFVFSVISALCMLLVEFRRSKIMRPIVILVIGVYVAIQSIIVEDTGRQVGSYMKIVDKGYNDGKYYLMIENEPSLQLLCDKNIYSSVDKDDSCLIEYRVIGESTKISYIQSIEKE